MDEPEQRESAPGRLTLVQDLVNSVEMPDGDDQLVTAAAAAVWLRLHGATAVSRLTEAERCRLVEVREGLRTLLLAHTDEDEVMAAASVTRIMHEMNAANLRVVISAAGGELASVSSGVDGFLAELLAGIVEATIAGTWCRLKVCREDDCRWAFFDRSKNGCGAWCSMRVCGSRAKARAYRQRRRGSGAVAG